MKIAIQGHPTRGEDVKKLLETLINKPIEYDCDNPCIWYEIHGKLIIPMTLKNHNYKYYTLEEFETNFPFKIGDKVITNDCYIGIITQLIPDHLSSYCVKLNNVYSWHTPSSLRLYKEMNTRNITLTLEKAKEWYKRAKNLKK